MQELRALVAWLRDVEAVVVRKEPVTYQDEKTGISYSCQVERLFEVKGEVWVHGRDPGCGCWTGAPVRLCSLSAESRQAKPKKGRK